MRIFGFVPVTPGSERLSRKMLSHLAWILSANRPPEAAVAVKGMGVAKKSAYADKEGGLAMNEKA